MKFIQGKDRSQTEFFCLDQAISDDNEVRLIDLFVSAINLSDYGFKTDFIENGRPAYHPTDLLKLFIYGYMNRIPILANEDKDLSIVKKQEIKDKIDKHQKHKDKYKGFKKQLDETGEVQISTSDPDSRQMITRNNITEVAYNVQSTVDAKTILGHTDFTAIFDKGYHTGTEFDYAHKQGVEVIVAFPDVASHAPDISFDVEHFNYNKEQDEYTCPAGNLLTTNGRWYNKASGKTINRVKHYKTKACLTCTLFERCTRNKSGRFIERSEHMDLIDANKQKMKQNMEIYRKRQAIVEHPFGVIKRQWDFYYIMTKKTMKHASADVGLIFTCYNLRRIFNLIDQNSLKKFLKELVFDFLFLRSYFKALYAIFQMKLN